MDMSRILLLGKQTDTFRTGSLHNHPNLAEFSSIIWYPRTINAEWAAFGSSSTGEKIAEMIAWVKKGNILVVVGHPPEQSASSYHKGNSRFTVNLLANEIFRNIAFQQVSGTLIEYCGPIATSGLLSGISGTTTYEAIIESKDLTPLFRVSTLQKGEEQIVGGYRKFGNGVILFAPPLHFGFDKPKLPQFHIYHYNLACVLEHLESETEVDRPDWFDNFQTAEEQGLRQKIDEVQKRIRDLEAQTSKLHTDSRSEQAEKNLITSTGDVFAMAVADALRELGLSVVEGPKQRADLIAWDGTRLAALEVKGLEGGAREKNIGQVKRWTADISVALSSATDENIDSEIKNYQSKLVALGVPLDSDIECKGIVVLNTHRKLPIDQRPENFGEPVQKVIVRSDVCALTGLQLFTLLHEARSIPHKRSGILDKLFSTRGVLAEGLLWDSYLRKIV